MDELLFAHILQKYSIKGSRRLLMNIKDVVVRIRKELSANQETIVTFDMGEDDIQVFNYYKKEMKFSKFL